MTPRTIRLLLLAAVAVSLASATAATASSPDTEQVALTSAGQAAARAVVLTRSDLGTTGAWTGGAMTPSPPTPSPCSDFRPKQNDLTLIGQAETKWSASGVEIDSDAQVLRTPAMVRLDWQRTVLASQMQPCLRSALAKQFAGRLISFGQLGFPRVSTYARAYRAVVNVSDGTTSVRVLVDIVLVGGSRTEVTLTVIAPYAARASISAAEVRLARLVVSRIRA